MVSDFLWDLFSVIWIDLILSADNALLIGLAASGLQLQDRRRVIFWGISFAVITRIIFAIIVTFLLAIKGIIFFAGLLLAWISWRLYADIRHKNHNADEPEIEDESLQTKQVVNSSVFSPQMKRAIFSIFFADVSMSLDNVVSVAAIARDNIIVLIFGLTLSIVLMAFGSSLIANLINRYIWISYAGLAFLVYLSADMLVSGFPGLIELIESV